MLSKIRHFVNFSTLKSIYHAIFQCYLNYSFPFSSQNASSIKRLLVPQKKSLRIMHFLKRNAHTCNLFKNLNVFKLPDQVTLKNDILICKYFNDFLPKILKIGSRLQQFHVHIIPEGVNKVALKDLVIIRNYMEGFSQYKCQYKSANQPASQPASQSVSQSVSQYE